MGAVSGRATPLDTGPQQTGAALGPAPRRPQWARWLEVLGVALSPPIAALVLRLRLMAPSLLPDPSMHSVYIIAPRDVFTRYAATYAATARLREGGRVGFLVPARLAYRAFGAVPGFLITRYVFALIAVVPVYLLLRRLYGPPAGVVGILVVLSSPVLVTAWGTDYPDSAVVSYAAGALACLAMPCAPRWRRAWLAAAGLLFVLAVWSHGVAVPLAAATLAAYVGLRLLRDRAGLAVDLAVLAGVAVAVTGLLFAAAAVLIGHANFIGLTWQAFRFLSQPSQQALWHSAKPGWAPYLAYLLVPPAVLGAFAVAVARRGRAVPAPVLLVGVAAAVQLAVYLWLQFAGHVQALEEMYFSSTLWAGVCLTLAITIAELTRPLSGRTLARWLPAAVLLAVCLGYEAAPRVPPFGWVPYGVVLAAVVIIAAAAARGGAGLRRPLMAATATGLALIVLAGATLVLTVAPVPRHPRLAGTVFDPKPAYATALGGSGTTYLDTYRLVTALPQNVGYAAYRGEQLLVWELASRERLVAYNGIYHAGFNTFRNQTPVLTERDRDKLAHRKPGELLLMGTGRSLRSFRLALRTLAAYQPTLIRQRKLRAGHLVLRIWVIRLGVYYHPPAHAG